MSRLEELIAELCPDGVEYISIGSVMNYEQPTKYIVNDTNYNDDYSIPVLTAGQSFILGYTNETDGFYDASKEHPVIIFDDFTGAFKWVDFTFKVKSSAMKMLTAKNDIASLRYLFHIMGNIGYSSDEHKRLWISIYSTIKIPLPPLPVQREIVRILDNFTKLTAELTAELTARKKQYEYYRDSLFNDKDIGREYLNEVGIMKRGTYVTKKNIRTGNIPVILGGQQPAYYCDSSNHDGEAIVISRSGAYAGFVSFWNEPIFVTDGFIIETKSGLKLKFLYYYLKSIQNSLHQSKRGGGVPHVRGSEIMKIPIPVPPLEEQERIVATLDRFDTLTNDLSSGLPAEIEARRKQYEYYRDKLLTFKEKSS